MVWTGSVSSLHMFFNEINKIHETLKFTMTHTTPKSTQSECHCDNIQAIPFLDTSCEIKQGNIETDLYRKPTDKNQYLLISSCHPPEVTSSIPFSLCMRINRICSEPEARDNIFHELKEILIARCYPQGIINSAIQKARSIPKEEALKQVTRRKSNTRSVFVVSWDPRLPSISDLTRKHWRVMSEQDPYLQEVFFSTTTCGI